ncbi:MAG: ATP-binding protein [bacterium]|nr:ATP-binding protein [bacterium]
MYTPLFSVVISIITIASAIMFIYYGFRNSLILRAVNTQYLLIIGTLIITFVEIIYSTIVFVSYSAFNLKLLYFVLFLLFVIGVSILLLSNIVSVLTIAKNYRIPLLKLLRIIPHKIYRSLSMLILLLAVLLFWAIILSIIPEATWSIAIQLAIMVAFINFAIGERKLFMSMKLKVIALEHIGWKMLFKDDVLAVNSYIVMLNMFLTVVRTATGDKILKNTLVEYFENNPMFFENCKIRDDLTIDVSAIALNINKLYGKDKIKIICNLFSLLISKIITLYGTVTSPTYATEVFEKTFAIIKNKIKDTPIFFDIIQSFPDGILKYEKLTILNKEELEMRVRSRTIELEREKTFSENIIATIPDLLVILDKNLKIISNNQNFYTLFHGNYREIKGRFITDVLLKKVNKVGTLRSNLTEIIKTGKMLDNLEIIYKTGKSDAKIFEIVGKVISLEEKGKILVIFKDVTEKKRIEQQKFQTEKIKILEQLAPWLAHQLKNPLAIILGHTQLISRNDKIAKIDDKNISNSLSIIGEQINRASNLVTGLLNLTTRSDIKFSKLNIHLILDKIITLHHYLLKKQGIIIKRNYFKLSSLEIEGDENQLSEVFTVILNNSIESMSKNGQIEIYTGIKDNKSQIEVKIKDTGSGIEKKYLDKIFNPFFTTKNTGTGLGLFFSKIIINNHKGDIKINSRKGKGTEVIIRLPVSHL